MATSSKYDELSSQNYLYCTPSELDLLLAKMRLREIIEINLQQHNFIKIVYPKHLSSSDSPPRMKYFLSR